MIDKTAIISNKEKFSESASIGPYSVIGPDVEIEDNVIIHSHVSITGNTKIGSGCKIYPFSSIGNHPQDLKFKGEKTKLVIGKNNIIREYVTINPGTEGGGGVTTIGDNCLFMVSSHVAHDCNIGNNVIIANNVPIGGHGKIGEGAVIGGNAAVHQFTRVGKFSMVGGMTGVTKDVIPYSLSTGNRNYLDGLNLIGLRRKNISNKIILEAVDFYKNLFQSEDLNENLKKIDQKFKDNIIITDIIKFIEEDKKRPIAKPKI